MHALSRQQIILVVVLTIAWGVNWPVMKLGVTSYPPLTFRALSMWLGLPVLGAALLLMRVVAARTGALARLDGRGADDGGHRVRPVAGTSGSR